MNKQERMLEIVRLVNLSGTVMVNDLIEILQVSDMTIRRDLASLEQEGQLTRIHGGAKSNSRLSFNELSHEEKHHQNMQAKRLVAQKALQLIEEGDSIFLGPGTSVEVLAEEIHCRRLQVVTNCWPIFHLLFKKRTDTFKVILLGGEMRERTQAFVGEMTNHMLGEIYFNKMFFSGNGVKNGRVLTSDFNEAQTQRLALGRSNATYLLIDDSKLGREDFTSICNLNSLTSVITDLDSDKVQQEIKPYTAVIV